MCDQFCSRSKTDWSRPDPRYVYAHTKNHFCLNKNRPASLYHAAVFLSSTTQQIARANAYMRSLWLHVCETLCMIGDRTRAPVNEQAHASIPVPLWRSALCKDYVWIMLPLGSGCDDAHTHTQYNDLVKWWFDAAQTAAHNQLKH